VIGGWHQADMLVQEVLRETCATDGP
jgi:hypothetical protein